MQSQDEGKVHQLLGLGIERPSVVRLLEVIGVALAGVEIALSNIRHAYMLPRPSELFWAARDRLKDGKSRSGSRSRQLDHQIGPPARRVPSVHRVNEGEPVYPH